MEGLPELFYKKVQLSVDGEIISVYTMHISNGFDIIRKCEQQHVSLDNVLIFFIGIKPVRRNR